MLLPCPWLLPNYNAEFRGYVEDLMDQQDLGFYLLQDLGSRGGTVPTPPGMLKQSPTARRTGLMSDNLDVLTLLKPFYDTWIRQPL